MTSLGGLCLELLSSKGLESAFLEGIGLKHQRPKTGLGLWWTSDPYDSVRHSRAVDCAC